MKDHKLIMKRVPRGLRASRLVVHFSVDLFLWLGMGLCARSGLNILAAGLPPLLFAAFTFRAFGLMHDGVHFALSKKRSVNDRVGSLYGVFCFLPFEGWREFHLDHHRWSGNIERDPASRILNAFKQNHFKMSSRLPNWAWLSWIPLLGFLQHVVFWKGTLSLRRTLFLLGVSIYLGATSLVIGILPLGAGLLLYLMLVEVVNLPHHLGLEQSSGSDRFEFHDQDQFARTCLYPKWFARNVLLNFNLHSVHHLFPHYPWYQLEDLNEEVSRVPSQMPTSTAFDWILVHRRIPLERVFQKTFKSADFKKSA